MFHINSLLRKGLCMDKTNSTISANDLGIKVWLEGNDLNLEMPLPIYNNLTDIFANYCMTIEDSIKEFINWSIANPEEFKKWIESKRLEINNGNNSSRL